MPGSGQGRVSAWSRHGRGVRRGPADGGRDMPGDRGQDARVVGHAELVRHGEQHRVGLVPGTSTRMLLEQALQAVELTPRIAVETDAREAIVPLVLAGAGAALLPATLAEEAARRGAVVRAAQPRIVRRIGLVQRDGPLSPAARAFSALAAVV